MADRQLSHSFRQRKSRDTPTKKQESSQDGASNSRPAVGINGTSVQIEELLVKFDLTSKYGPCQGLSRIERQVTLDRKRGRAKAQAL
ncbi:hypothetical protein WJX73_005147 [Symbiochloris irregularis]|uniref:Uncharacterized protein n=1 Tax=Symbiochloris irregularis TaxID=706552 RepID=A0AAW1PGW2_9CHLO